MSKFTNKNLCSQALKAAGSFVCIKVCGHTSIAKDLRLVKDNCCCKRPVRVLCAVIKCDKVCATVPELHSLTILVAYHDTFLPGTQQGHQKEYLTDSPILML